MLHYASLVLLQGGACMSVEAMSDAYVTLCLVPIVIVHAFIKLWYTLVYAVNTQTSLLHLVATCHAWQK